MKHLASRDFWQTCEQLPRPVRELADRSFTILKNDPRHLSLHLKKTARFWSVRIGLRYRPLAVEEDGDLAVFWIGSHADYDAMMR